MSDDGLPVVTPDTLPDASDSNARPPVGGVLLAAGTSSRFGTANKLLAEVDGEPLVRPAVRTLLDADLASVTVVLGHEAGAVREALEDLDVTFVVNSDYQDGQSTSVRVGVNSVVERDATAAVFLPGDMPFVAPNTVDLLVAAHLANVGTAIAAAHRGRRGNPVLFDHRHFDALRAVEGDTGGRTVLLDGDESVLVETDDPGVRTDVDTVADLDRDDEQDSRSR